MKFIKRNKKVFKAYVGKLVCLEIGIQFFNKKLL